MYRNQLQTLSRNGNAPGFLQRGRQWQVRAEPMVLLCRVERLIQNSYCTQSLTLSKEKRSITLCVCVFSFCHWSVCIYSLFCFSPLLLSFLITSISLSYSKSPSPINKASNYRRRRGRENIKCTQVSWKVTQLQ